MPKLKTVETLLGSSRAARHIEINISTLGYWRRKGELKPTFVVEGPNGPRYRYSPEDLAAFQEKIEYDA